MSSKGYVYTLIDPRTDEPKYVGATQQPRQRFNNHLCTPTNSDMEEWFKELESDDKEPYMNIIKICNINDLSDKERKLIDQLSERYELLNSDKVRPYRWDETTDKTNRTTIDVQSPTLDRLRAKKEGNETYDGLINRILDDWEKTND